MLRRWDFSSGLREQMALSPEPFGNLRVTERPPERLAPSATHAAVYADLVAALDEGRPPRCGADEARRTLELANAIALSSWTNGSFELPLDRNAYEAALARLMGEAQFPAPTLTGRPSATER